MENISYCYCCECKHKRRSTLNYNKYICILNYEEVPDHGFCHKAEYEESGNWIKTDDTHWKCSVCGYILDYCPDGTTEKYECPECCSSLWYEEE